jgi:outer membrane immunogenic protein
MNWRLAVAAVLWMTAPATAADIRRSVAPAQAPAPIVGYGWSGAYVGVNLGYLWSTVGALGVRPSGVAGGVQAGYNWQVGQVVFGGEADIQGSAANDTFAAYKFSNPWFGSARGRLGYAFDNVLVYATAGLAYGGGKLDIAGLSERNGHLGWTAGGGIEVAFAPRWSGKAEYLFIGLGDNTYVLSGASSGIDSHVGRLGVNYRF